MEHAQNHVWRDLFGRMPFNSKVYWKAAKAEVHNLVAAGAGAARQHAENVADDACQAAAVAAETSHGVSRDQGAPHGSIFIIYESGVY